MDEKGVIRKETRTMKKIKYKYVKYKNKIYEIYKEQKYYFWFKDENNKIQIIGKKMLKYAETKEELEND